MDIVIDLLKSEFQVLKFGESDDYFVNEDLVVFSDPKYFMRNDPKIGYLYEDYKKAFVVFNINYN